MGFGIVAENISVRRSAGAAFEQALEILAEAHVEHLVGFVEYDRFELGEHERATLEVIAQSPRRTDHDVNAAREHLRFAPRIHAADTRRDPRAGARV